MPVALVPPAVVTVTSTVPALPAGAVDVIDPELTTVTLVAGLAPNATVAPETKCGTGDCDRRPARGVAG